LPWAKSDDPVEVIQPPGARLRSRQEIHVRRVRLVPGEVVRTPLGYATSPARTVFDLARQGNLLEDVAWVDGLLRVTEISTDDARALVPTHPGVRGLRALDRVLDLCDPRAESPRESKLRVILVTAGLPKPECQVVVRDATGRFVARLDLAWPHQRIGVEYDGAHHRGAAQHSKDLFRHNRLRACGWTVIQVDAALFANENALIQMVSTVLATARPID
jgi:very-short-patch-repair endonuclease